MLSKLRNFNPISILNSKNYLSLICIFLRIYTFIALKSLLGFSCPTGIIVLCLPNALGVLAHVCVLVNHLPFSLRLKMSLLHLCSWRQFLLRTEFSVEVVVLEKTDIIPLFFLLHAAVGTLTVTFSPLWMTSELCLWLRAIFFYWFSLPVLSPGVQDPLYNFVICPFHGGTFPYSIIASY